MKFIKPSFMTILVLIPIFFATHECRIISSHDADETVVQEMKKQLSPETKKADLSKQNPELNLFEGDIKIRPIDGIKPSAVYENRIWPTKKIPYVITPNVFTPSEVNLILDAMKAFKNKTCIEFIPRTTEKDYISIIRGSGCWSYVGRTVGMQEVSLDNDCVYSDTVKHELMHATGFWHEQSRIDRDDYVKIYYDNIQDGMEGNFNKYDSATVQSLNTTYDLKSIMHYSWNDFAIDPSKPTMTDKNGNKVGPSNDFTLTDILDLNRLYKCSNGNSNGSFILWNETTWNNGRFVWGSDCDIVGKNIRQVQKVKRENCGGLCAADLNCTHFTWRSNGTCTLKIAPKLSSATRPLKGAMCGYVTRGNSNFQWKDWYQGRGKWDRNCDFPGNNIRVAVIPARTTCFSLCSSEPKCTSYAVRSRPGSVNKINCYLKTGKSPIAVPYTDDVNALCSMISARI